MREYRAESFDVIVVGAGHAGCEAALASARLGLKTAIFAISLESVGDMPCNPNIGGTGKGHLVREIDALGGQMAKTIDETLIQSRMLNTSKGPAVHSLRVQADKSKYHMEMKKTLENEANLILKESEVVDFIFDGKKVCGVKTATGACYPSRAVIVSSGTYLKGRILMGELSYPSGPHGMRPSFGLSPSLEKMGIKLMRFKTGTPARIKRSSIDFSKTERIDGDSEIVPFSFMNFGKNFEGLDQLPCYLTYTTKETEEIILKNLDRSPMYSGKAKGQGPRYCPSIEDKIVRFPDRDGHQVFLEPEGRDTEEIYVQGVSSTLPEEVQEELYRTIIGLENVEFMRPAYGIEYDCIDARRLKRTLEDMDYPGLYFAGQINGSSGYEEAAAQGLMAGINAALKIKGKEPFILDRSDAYIGVLIDDLVTKGTNEPYRMMTSRAEYRLSLRQDNADIRLTERGYELGLASKERYDRMLKRKKAHQDEVKRLMEVKVNPSLETNKKLLALNTEEIKTGESLYDLLKRPELSYYDLIVLDENRRDLSTDIVALVETEIKYEGYIRRQEGQISHFKKMEKKSLEDISDYEEVPSLKKEAIQKLNQIRPESLGQASRISGVSPGDINCLLIYLEKIKRERNAG